MPTAPIETHHESPYEKRLVARLQAGEAEALGILFDLHVDRIFAFARHLLGSREDAEEVVTEAFLRAFQRATDYRGECPFRGWLFGITRNLCIDKLRQPRLMLLEPDAFERHSDRGQAAAQMETSLVVQQALAQLSEEHRLVLTLCDVEEWDAHEVAAILEKSLPATKSLLYRARRALRTELTAQWDEDEEEERPNAL